MGIAPQASPQSITPPWVEANYQLWDWAGVAGLHCAQALMEGAIAQLAPWQSLETTCRDIPCSVLRLAEGNFRIALPSTVDFTAIAQQAERDWRVWMKPCLTLGAIALPDPIGMQILPHLALTKPIYRLDRLQPNCAVPARIGGLAIVVWRHSVDNSLAIEIQAAQPHLGHIQSEINRRLQA